MAETTRTFSFATTAEGFLATAGSAAQSLTHSTTEGNPAGSLQATVSGKNKTKVVSWWEWTGTWENLGVPAGATVTAVRVNAGFTRVRENTTAATGGVDVGPYELRDSSATLLATLWAGRNVASGTAEAGWTAIPVQADQAVPTAQQPSNTTVKIRLADAIGTGNSVSAVVTTHDDEVAITVSYTASTPVLGASSITSVAGVASSGASNPTPKSGAAQISGAGATSSGGVSSKPSASAISGAGSTGVTALVSRPGAGAVASRATLSAAGVYASVSGALITGLGSVSIGTGETTRTFDANEFSNPRSNLITGPGRQRIAIRVRKQSAGAPATNIRVDLMEGASQTPLATVIPATDVTSTAWVTLEGTFDAALLADVSGAGVWVRVTNVTDGSDPALDVGALEWLYTSEALSYEPVSGVAVIASTAYVTPTSQLALTGSALINPLSSVAAAGIVSLKGAAALGGNATLSSAPGGATLGRATVDSEAILLATGLTSGLGSSSVLGRAGMAIDGSSVVRGAGAVSGLSNLAPTGVVTLEGEATLAGSTSLTPASRLALLGRASLEAGAGLLTVELISKRGGVSVLGDTEIIVGGGGTIRGAATLSGSTSLGVAGIEVLLGTATISAAGGVGGQGVLVLRSVSPISGGAILGINPILVARATAAFQSVSTITPDPEVARMGFVSLPAGSALLAGARVIDLTVPGVIEPGISVSLVHPLSASIGLSHPLAASSLGISHPLAVSIGIDRDYLAESRLLETGALEEGLVTSPV